MTNLGSNSSFIEALFREIFFPLEQPYWVASEISSSGIYSGWILNHVMSYWSRIKYRFGKIIFVIEDHPVSLDPHVGSISGHRLEQLKPLLISLGVALHPSRSHHGSFSDIRKSPLLVSFSPIHSVWINSDPSINLWHYCHCVFVFYSSFPNNLYIIRRIVKVSEVVGHSELVISLSRIIACQIASFTVEIILILTHIRVSLSKWNPRRFCSRDIRPSRL